MSRTHHVEPARRQGSSIQVSISFHPLSVVLAVLLLLTAAWAVGATYVALAGAAIATFTSAALIKAAAVLGAFILLGCLVVAREWGRSRESRLDAEFDRGREESVFH